jgi:hypothetical protein
LNGGQTVDVALDVGDLDRIGHLSPQDGADDELALEPELQSR